MAHGVVPAGSALRGANGYLGGLLGGGRRGDDEPAGAAAEERQSLLAAGGAAAFELGPRAPDAAGGACPGRAPPPPPRLPVSSSPGGGGPRPSGAGARGRAPPPAPPLRTAGAGGAPGRPNLESLDYELAENTVYRTDTAARTHLDHITKSGAKWSMCFALGVLTAVAAFAVNLGVENLAGFKFWATLTLLDRGQALASYAVYAGTNVALVTASVWLTTALAPAAAGSGIAEVKAYLNGIDVPGIFLCRTLAVKLLGSVGAVAGGLAVGKEGPFVHAGAAMGALLSQARGARAAARGWRRAGGGVRAAARRRPNARRRPTRRAAPQGGTGDAHLPWFKRFWNDRDRADMVACGTAAGVAAAFRAPVGGVLFALEEMTSWWRNQLLWYAFFTTAVVSVTVRTLMRLCSAEKTGACGFFGAGGYLLYEITEGQSNFEALELLPMLLLGVIGGLLGSAFNHLNAALSEVRKARLARHGARGRLWEGAAAALLVSTVSFLLPMLVACRPCPPDVAEGCPRSDNSHSGNFVGFGCAASSQYNDLATIFFNTQDDAIRNLFSSRTKAEYGVGALTTFTVTFFALAVACYGLAVPTGLFVPSILCGAAYGRLVGVFVADMRPGATGAIDEGTYALLGAASFLGGAMRMTVATCVMLLELTNNLPLLPMMMLVTLVAKAVGDGTGVKPLYESLIDLKGLPFLERSPHGLMRHITAAEAAGQPAVSFARVERVGTLLAVLRGTPHNGFAVLGSAPDGEPHILGIVLRSQLAVLLRSRRCFQPTPFVSEVAGRVAFSYQQSDFARPISEPPPDAAGLSLSEQEQGMYIDLGPYANPSYYVVQEDTSLAKAYTLFRSLGLRHLAVIPRASAVVGVITRHDLQASALEATCLEQLTLGAGVAGLASALRGTVRDAVDAYQHQATTSSSGAPSPPPPAATALPPPLASLAPGRDRGGGGGAGGAGAQRPGGKAPARLGSGEARGTPMAAAASALEIAADGSSCGSGSGALAWGAPPRGGSGRPGLASRRSSASDGSGLPLATRAMEGSPPDPDGSCAELGGAAAPPPPRRGPGGKSSHVASMRSLGLLHDLQVLARERGAAPVVQHFAASEVAELPPRLRALFEDNKVLKEQARRYKARAADAERGAAAAEQQCLALQAAVRALKLQLAEGASSAEALAAEAGLRAQADAATRALEKLQHAHAVLGAKLETDARSHRQALAAGARERGALEQQAAELAVQVEAKDREARAAVLAARHAQRALAEARGAAARAAAGADARVAAAVAEETAQHRAVADARVHLMLCVLTDHGPAPGRGGGRDAGGEYAPPRQQLAAAATCGGGDDGPGGGPGGSSSLGAGTGGGGARAGPPMSRADAALVLQAGARGFLARRALRRQRAAEQQAAVLIQAGARGMRARRQVQAMLQAAQLPVALACVGGGGASGRASCAASLPMELPALEPGAQPHEAAARRAASCSGAAAACGPARGAASPAGGGSRRGASSSGEAPGAGRAAPTARVPRAPLKPPLPRQAGSASPRVGGRPGGGRAASAAAGGAGGGGAAGASQRSQQRRPARPAQQDLPPGAGVA
ncbi:CLC-D [Scenedesmus sp. PABB004]|nr:CLC-D [Scenedesmus sp. PABB004]